MASDAFIGVLTGLGTANRARQKNIFDLEVARRSKYEKLLQERSTNPAYRTEAQDQLTQLLSELIQTPYEKQLPKDFERRVMDALTSVEPKFGQSWLGGQTERGMEVTPMPIQAELEPDRPPPGPAYTTEGLTPEAVAAGAMLYQRTPAQMRQPEPQTVTAPMPQPPPGVKLSSRISPREAANQKIAEAIQTLEALGPIQLQQALAQKRGESAINIEEERAKIGMQPDEFFAVPPEAGVAKRSTGEFIRQPKFRPLEPDDLSFQEASYEDFKKRSDLTKKYGSDRMGYQAWRDAVELDRQRVGAQNRFDIQDRARNFSQERQLAAQLLSETEMDRQRLQSYQNLQSVGNELTGANQIVVLYNFIRLMDPNRVSEGELAIAQRAQTVPEEWKAIIGRFLGVPNIFSPEGASRLRAAADDMGKGIQKRVGNIAQRYKNIAEGSGLNPENVVRGIPELLGTGGAPISPPAAGGERRVLINGVPYIVGLDGTVLRQAP